MSELIKVAREVCEDLLKDLAEKHPEYLPLYEQRCRYLDMPIPEAEKRHHAQEIVMTAARLGTKIRHTEDLRIRVPPALKKAIEEEAKKQGKTVSQLVREILTNTFLRDDFLSGPTP